MYYKILKFIYTCFSFISCICNSLGHLELPNCFWQNRLLLFLTEQNSKNCAIVVTELIECLSRKQLGLELAAILSVLCKCTFY